MPVQYRMSLVSSRRNKNLAVGGQLEEHAGDGRSGDNDADEFGERAEMGSEGWQHRASSWICCCHELDLSRVRAGSFGSFHAEIGD